MQYIVTIKILARNPDHDPKNKRTGRCLVSPHCTDVTGQHHSFVVDADDDDAARDAVSHFAHITRIERVGG